MARSKYQLSSSTKLPGELPLYITQPRFHQFGHRVTVFISLYVLSVCLSVCTIAIRPLPEVQKSVGLKAYSWFGLQPHNLSFCFHFNYFLHSLTFMGFWSHLTVDNGGFREGLWLWPLSLVANGMWHVTRDTWHVTCDTWHVTQDTWFFLYFISRPGWSQGLLYKQPCHSFINSPFPPQLYAAATPKQLKITLPVMK